MHGFPRFQTEALKANLAIVNQVREIAARHKATAGQIALSWVLSLGERVVPIPGSSKRTHLEENLAATAIELSSDDLNLLNSLQPPVGSRYPGELFRPR